jgi:hypothetical protein
LPDVNDCQEAAEDVDFCGVGFLSVRAKPFPQLARQSVGEEEHEEVKGNVFNQ